MKNLGLIGGKAHGMRPRDFNQTQLRRGIKVEMEHTNKRSVAREIAMDHLVEDPQYYKKLAKVHLDGLDVKPMSLLRLGALGTCAYALKTKSTYFGAVGYALLVFTLIPKR